MKEQCTTPISYKVDRENWSIEIYADDYDVFREDVENINYGIYQRWKLLYELEQVNKTPKDPFYGLDINDLHNYLI